MKPFPRHPPHPERVCWGCDRYCAHTDMLCGNGSVRTPHPVELFGPHWADETQGSPAPQEGAGRPRQDTAHG